MGGRRILLVTDWMPQPGGSEAYTSRLREGLAAAGDDVRLLTSTAGSAADGTADYPAFGSTSVPIQAALQIANPFAFAAARRALRQFKPDVALVHLFAYHLSPAVVLALDRLPIVMTIVDYKVICPLGSKLLPGGAICHVHAGVACLENRCLSLPHWLRDRPRYRAIDRAVRRAAIVLACSWHLAVELAEHGIAARRVTLPGIGPGSGYARNPAPDPEFVYCGRLTAEKGVLSLVRVFSRVRAAAPRARLTFVGEGPLRPDIERLAADLHISDAITITGWLDMPGVERHLARAWGLVAPSLWAEPFGQVAVEAILRGVPVVATRLGGFGETVEDGITGLLYPNGDEGALFGCLQRLAFGQVFPARTLDEAAVRRAASAYSLERHVGVMQAFIDEAVTARRAAG
jgi:glycosyltransferase involved in cell wall biosynthesis